MAQISLYLGDDTTSNQAEYLSLINSLIKAKQLGIEEVEICSDSELLIFQLEGKYKVKNPNIIGHWTIAKELLEDFHYKLTKIPREENEEADMLANKAIDQKEKIGGEKNG